MILKTKDLREKTDAELQEELETLRKDLFAAKMDFHSRKLENHSSLREMRKSVARIQTLLIERQQNGEEEAAA